jgi:hypothetical protein
LKKPTKSHNQISIDHGDASSDDQRSLLVGMLTNLCEFLSISSGYWLAKTSATEKGF